MSEQYPGWLSATLASDATEGRHVLPGWITALQPDSCVIGPAFVILAAQDDNQALVHALADSPPPPGSVLVVGGMNTSRTATIGGLMALEIQNLGIAGLVTDGLVRDSQEIRQLGLPVWCRGTTPSASSKRNPGIIGGVIAIGGAQIQAGDLVIADGDGVVIWPQGEYAELLKRAEAKYSADNLRLERLQKIREQKSNPA